jgi:hypothetical protein
MAAVAERVGLGFPSGTRVLAVEVVDPYTLGGVVSTRVAVARMEGLRSCRSVESAFADSESCKTDGLGGALNRRVRNPNKFFVLWKLEISRVPAEKMQTVLR